LETLPGGKKTRGPQNLFEKNWKVKKRGKFTPQIFRKERSWEFGRKPERGNNPEGKLIEGGEVKLILPRKINGVITKKNGRTFKNQGPCFAWGSQTRGH